MKSQPQLKDIQHSIYDAIYERYQQELYSLSACHSDYDEDKIQEEKLLIDLLSHDSTCCHKKQPKVEPIKHHRK